MTDISTLILLMDLWIAFIEQMPYNYMKTVLFIFSNQEYLKFSNIIYNFTDDYDIY